MDQKNLSESPAARHTLRDTAAMVWALVVLINLAVYVRLMRRA